jgi:hypothetical protein
VTAALPPGVVIAPPPPELKLGKDADDSPWWHRSHDDDDQRDPSALQTATKFPMRVVAEPTEILRTSKLFACSGSPDSYRYQEATRFRTMPDMGWEEARAALNRLMADIGIYSRHRVTTGEFVALAEFALSASGFEGFAGRKGDHAVKLRKELGSALLQLWTRLNQTLHAAKDEAGVLVHPITNRLSGEGWRGNAALWAMVPATDKVWVEVIEATPDQTMAALDILRATLAKWQTRQQFAADVARRLQTPASVPSAQEYAEGIHIAEMLAFTGQKLTTLYAGIMHSMPIYRLYPAAPEREAIAHWWPWGRPALLFDGKPPAPSARHVLDPATITATRPQDVVKEVMAKTGMNRTTAQKLTAAMRSDMRRKREHEARSLLQRGATKAKVAEMVRLSPSRISALFKGQKFPKKSRQVQRTA